MEAKLTETDFQTAPARMIERYRDLAEVFDPEHLLMSGDVVSGYQLIRGVLASHAQADHSVSCATQGVRTLSSSGIR